MRKATKVALAVAFALAAAGPAASAATPAPQADGPLCPGYAAVLAAQAVIGDSPDVAMFVRRFFGCEEKYPGG